MEKDIFILLNKILDEPEHDNATARRLGAIGDFFAAVDASEEDVPEIERVKFNREANL
jgi:hypothetical protein